MPRLRPTSRTRLHSTLGDAALAWRALDAKSSVASYGYGHGITHLLASDHHDDAAMLTVHFQAQFARRHARPEEADIARWVDDCAAVAKRTPRRDTRCWADFARTSRHLFRKDGWEPWRVLFQAAMDHADDSAVTVAAEAFEASGKRDWAWLRWVNRPSVWREDPCLAVMVGHKSAVMGAIELDRGRILSWSMGNTLRLWDGATGKPLREWATLSHWLDADLVASLRPHERALHHSLHLGFELAEAKADLAVFKGGRHLRICRFMAPRNAV